MTFQQEWMKTHRRRSDLHVLANETLRTLTRLDKELLHRGWARICESTPCPDGMEYFTLVEELMREAESCLRK